jgi:hypothetical protein
MNEYVQMFLALMMFSVMIHAVVDVVKGVALRPIRFFREILQCIFRDKPMSAETIKSLVFILSFLYCRAFDYDAMTGLLKVTIAENNALAWNLAYVGTSAIVYVGVDVVFLAMKKGRALLMENAGGIA